MNFSSLEYFEMLARERSFTRAAQKLHITQQSLSAHIAKIEQELGCQLVVRHVPLEITYAGQVLLRYAATFRKEFAMMQQEFSDISQNQRGVLRLGITYTRGRTILPEIIMAFQKLYPAISVDLVEDTNDALQRKLIEGDVDLAIANFPRALPGITLRDFYREEVVLLISRQLLASHYGTQHDAVVKRLQEGDYTALEDCPMVLGSADDIGGHIERSLLQRAGISHPRIMATSSNAETLLALCARGAGACFCSELLACAALSEDQLASLMMFRLGDPARYQIRFGYQEQSYQWSIMQKFMDVAVEAMTGQR